MNAQLDFPTIDMPEPVVVVATPPAPAPSEALPAVLSIKDAALAQFSATEATLHALAARHKDVVYDVTIPRQMSAARLARQEIRDHRYTVQRVEKSTLAELNDLKRDVKAEAERLIAIIDPVEAGVHAQIKAHEDKLAAEKAERDRIDAERCAKHQANIGQIRSYYSRCAGLPPERVANGIALLENMAIIETAWEEFYEHALVAKTETLDAMRVLLFNMQLRAADEAQRAENARLAAELAERQRLLDERAAELRRQQEALEAQERAAAALAERQRQEAELAAQNTTAQDSQQVLKATAPAPDATDRDALASASPIGGSMGTGQPAAAGPVGDNLRPDGPAKPLITVKQIGAKLGFALKGDFIIFTLGVHPTLDDKFAASDFDAICTKLIAHLHTLQTQV